MTARPAQFLIVLIGLSFSSFAQNIEQKDWYRADTSIAFESNLQDLRKEILSWKEYYSSAKNDAMVARCFYYLQQIDDRTTEDSLYFKNSLYIDSIIRNEGSSALLKTIMQLLKAKRNGRFVKKVHSDDKRRQFSSYDPAIDYKEMSDDQMDSLVRVQFEKALAMSAALPPADTKELRWLCTDTDIFIFTPDLQDIIHAERIAAFSHALYGSRDNDVIPLLALSQDEFLRLEAIEKVNTQENINRVFGFYKQWIQHHAANPSIYYYLESLARHEIFGNSKFEEEGSKLYEHYLQTNVSSPYDMVKAYAVYLLCDLWNRQAEQYNPIANSSIDDTRSRYAFKPEFKMHYVRSWRLYETHQQLFRQFPVLDGLIINMKAATEMPGLYLNMYGTQVPGSPVLSLLRFRNVEKLYIKIVRRDAEEKLPFNMPDRPDPYISKAAVQERALDLPKTDDYQWHNTFLKIDPLPPGRYLVIFSDSAIAAENRHLGHIEIAVTQIAVINTDQRVFVLNRQTGLPLTGASLITGKVSSKEGDVFDTTWNTSSVKTVNDSGFVTLNKVRNAVVKVSYQPGDVYRASLNEHESDLEYELYDEELYDNVQEFLMEKARMQIFTDRGLYRPGQKVHYKAIVFTDHPKTLERIVWSGKKLRSPFFRKLFRRGSPKLTIYLRDAMNRQLDSITIVPDEYGAISGSFVIPKDGITGMWSIACKDLNYQENSGSFLVEEYKRPSFEVLLEKPDKEFGPGDSIPVKIIVQSFAGARLSNTRVKYSVSVYGYMPHTKPDYVRRKDVLLSGTTYTDEKGELQLQIVDTAFAHIEIPDSLEYSLNYTVEVQATDATGESDDEYLSIVKSSRPVYIYVTVPEIIDRNAPEPIAVNTFLENIGIVKKQLQVRFIKVAGYSQDSENSKWPPMDISLYPQQELEKLFPALKSLPGQDTTEMLVYETAFTTGGDSFMLPSNKLPAGHYRMELVCRENGKILGETDREFSVFDLKANALPSPAKIFDHLPKTSVHRGEKITWTTANTENDVYAIYHIAWLSKTKAGISERSDYIMKPEKKGLNQWVYTIPQEAVGKLLLTHLYISGNELYQQEHEMEVEEIESAPEIIVEQFRSRVAPGAKETFTVSVKTKSERTLSQLMTTLYDAALDRLSRHAWYVPWSRFDLRLTTEWPLRIAEKVDDDIDFFPKSGRTGVFSLLEFDPLHYNFTAVDIQFNANNLTSNLTYGSSTLNGMVSGVVVTGYSSTKKNSTESTLAPELPQLPAPLIRKNFSETAFFYPRIYAGKDGFYTIKFTLPESVTTWKWKMMAHTQDGKFAYAERTLVSQLPLMVQPDMPRFLYQGDKIGLKSRISNLDSIDRSGTLECTIEDVVTGEDLTHRLLAANKKQFSVGRFSNTTGAFEIAVPADMLHPLRIKISAQAGSVSDGEEHIIPIQAKKILVSKHIALNDQKMVTRPSLPADANPYGIGMYIKAQPKASMVNALPWLANFPHGCAEQTFNKIFAHALAIKMARTDTGFHSPLAARKNWPVNQTMPEGIPEASMPWLNLLNRAAKQQQQLAKIVDTAASRAMIAKHFGNLARMQTENGGLSWFEGGNSSYYISSYILAGLGKLRIILNDMFERLHSDYQFFMLNLIRYSDERFMDQNITQSNHDLLQYLYGRSYFTDLYPLQPAAISHIDSLLKKGWDVAPLMSIGRQALLVTVTLRFLPATHDLHQTALRHLESLRQLAIRDNINGIRWKAISDGDDLNIRSEEWIVKIAEAFEEDPKDQVTVPGIMQWLLQTRQEHNWATTKATADVLSLLFRQQQSLTGGPQQWEARIDNKTYSVSNDLVNGSLFRFIEQNEFPAEIPVSGSNNGGINYYYFTENPEMDSAANGVKILRTLSLYNKRSSSWENISPSTVLSTGDKIRATLTITTPRMLQYVYIDEKRAASCEPTDATSGYEYATDFIYYKSVRDLGFQFFAEKIPSGRSTISYEMVVAKTGSFACGPASLECMYRPEIKAYSNSLSLEIKE